MYNLSHGIDARLCTGEFTLITDSASLKITRSILHDEQHEESERERERERGGARSGGNERVEGEED